MAYEPIEERIVQMNPDGTVIRYVKGFISSTDKKPMTGIADRSELFERDTGKWFLFNEKKKQWLVPDDYEGGGLSEAIAKCEGNIQVLKKFHHDDLTWTDIQRIVQNGVASDWFAIGDQIEIGWNDNILEWDVVSFDDVELQNGSIVPGMWLQSHYAMEGIQFDAPEAIYIVSSALPAGTYNFTIGTTWGSYCVAGKTYQFTTTKEIPVGGQIAVCEKNNQYSWGAPNVAPSKWRVYTFSSNADTAPLESNLTLTEGSGGTALGSVASDIKYGTSGMNNLQRAAFGYSRWSQSASRQYYNSSAASGAWWAPQNPFDRAPQQLASQAGFMAGFDSDFLAILKPIKVVTALNTVSDTDIGTSEVTYDTFFLPSPEQEYIVPQLEGVEGAYWQYWKERLDLDSPQTQGPSGVENHIRYAYNAKTSAQFCQLRSANRDNAGNTWSVTVFGSADNYYIASASFRGCPACVIC